MLVSTAIGFLAGNLTTAAFVPQVIKTWRSRSAADLSLGMYLIFAFGVFLWILYGVEIGAWPVIAANVVTLLLACIMIIFKFRFS